MTPLGHRSAQSASRSATPILIVAGLSGLLWSISGGEAGAWPLVILGLGFIAAIRLNRTDFLRRTLLDLPLALFLGTAVVGIWAGYEPGAAQKNVWLGVGGYVHYYAFAMQPS